MYLHAEPYSLIQVFTWRPMDSQGLNASTDGEQITWSDCDSTQADLSIR